MPQYWTEAEVNACLSEADAVPAIREMFRQLALGAAQAAPRQRVRAAGTMLHGMVGASAYLGYLGWKNYVTTRHGAQFHVGIYDATVGELIAIMEANRLGQLRTGAISAVALEALLPQRENRSLAIIGSGWQAESQLACIAQVMHPARISVYSRTPAKRAAFAEKMSEQLGIAVEPSDTSAAATRSADVVITVTTSEEPVVDASALDACQLLIAAGSNAPRRCEFPPSLVQRAQRVVCEWREGCRHEAGELIAAVKSGWLDWDQVHELSDCWSDPPLPEVKGFQIFKSVGIATADIALGALVVARMSNR